jgi:hypothetical protein
MVLSYCVRHSMPPLLENPTPEVPTQYWKPPGAVVGSLGVSQVGFQGWAITSIPRYPGYKTLTVAPEHFVERMTRAVCSMGGRIGTHMLLWVPSQDRLMTMRHHGMTGVMTYDRSRDVWLEHSVISPGLIATKGHNSRATRLVPT